MRLGRPALVVPTSEGKVDIRNVIVGWKDTREARRAILEALLLLKQAEHVTVCEVAPGDDLDAARTHLGDVVAWLKRNHVLAEPIAVRSGADDAASLTAVASPQSADLIVIGAYGHIRLREWILGGVTKSLLERSKRGLFLSH